ncbi:MAG: acyl-CoA N-acyltransferase [Thermodesulfobacteriota bacterium]
MPESRIIRVERRSDLRTFVNLPWKIHAGDPNWVPPLKKHVRRLLDPGKHPFWEFSDRILLMAMRGKEPVGRIAGIVDRNFNSRHDLRTGIWGFFECVNDPEVARMLFAAVEQWLAGQGMDYLMGPFSPSTNYEVGILTAGYEHQATFMMPYNPPYYPDLIERAGGRKEKDLLSFVVDKHWQQEAWMEKLVRRLNSRGDFAIRHVDMRRFREDMGLVKRIYDECWSGNWGFVPMTDREFGEMVDTLLKIADKDFVFFICYKNEPAGIAVLVPDINPVLKRLNGKLGLTGMIKTFLYRKSVRGLRGLLFGIREQYRQFGLPYLALDYLYRTLKERPEYEYIELGWNLEDNEEINQLEQDCGAKPFKRYRIYGKPI